MAVLSATSDAERGSDLVPSGRIHIVTSIGAPAPIGPYSQGVVAGGFLFCSGQIGLDPSTGSVVPGGVVPETERALLNVNAVLEEAGAGLDDVVKVTLFLRDMQDFQAVNQVYARRFGESKPARSAVGVASLPKGALVEIEVIAKVP